jgi:hypothetical protein
METSSNAEPILSAFGLIILIISAGIFGGTINYFIAAKDAFSVVGGNQDPPPCENDANAKAPKFPSWKILAANVVIGVGAAFLVPLFLATISSNLVTNLLVNSDGSGSIVDAFVFSGFCLLGAISSRAFIQTLSSKVLQEAQDANRKATKAEKRVDELKDEVKPIIEQATEPDDDTTVEKQDISIQTIIPPKLSDNETAVLEALNSSKYALRSKSGIAKQIGLERSEVNSILNRLIEKNLAAGVQGKNGVRWAMTPEGRRLIEENK